jgi:hypothetical protein
VSQYTFPRLGPTLAVANGQLDVSTPAAKSAIADVVTVSNPPPPTFSLSKSPSGLVQVFRNGLLQALTADYTLNGQVLTFVQAANIQPGDIIQIVYIPQ